MIAAPPSNEVRYVQRSTSPQTYHGRALETALSAAPTATHSSAYAHTTGGAGTAGTLQLYVSNECRAARIANRSLEDECFRSKRIE